MLNEERVARSSASRSPTVVRTRSGVGHDAHTKMSICVNRSGARGFGTTQSCPTVSFPLPRGSARRSRALQQLLQGDGQVADALSGGVVHRVRDCGGDADDADLTEDFGADGVHVLVFLR